MEVLKIAFLQMNIYWEDKTRNLAHLDDLLMELDVKTEVLILPEMFTTGFSMRSKELAEGIEGLTVQWMRNKAKDLACVICGSIIFEEKGEFLNRFLWVEPSGLIKHYDKRHLFAKGGEDDHYRAGRNRTIIEYKGWKICPLICYDLRFPVWSRNTEEYDLLIYVASWPEVRSTHWNKLLYARAIENQCYVAGVNRFGTDGNGLYYSGDSKLIDPYGDKLIEIKEREDIGYAHLSKQKITSVREALAFLKDQDSFDINL